MFTPHPKVRCFLFHDKLLGGCLTVLVCSFQDIDARIEVVDERCAGFYVHFSYGSSVYGVNRDMHIRAGTNGGPDVMAAYFYSVSLGNVFLAALGILSRIEVQAIDVGTDIIPVGQVIDYVQVMYSAYVCQIAGCRQLVAPTSGALCPDDSYGFASFECHSILPGW